MMDERHMEWAVRFDDGHIEVCASEELARSLAERLGAELLTREVHETRWTPSKEQKPRRSWPFRR